MMSASVSQAYKSQASVISKDKIRRATASHDPVILADIYKEEINIAIWQRSLSAALKRSVHDFILSNPRFQTAMTVNPQNALLNIRESLGSGISSSELSGLSGLSELSENIAELVDMFAYLFELSRVGLRLSVLESAMCPKFHVDRVPGRLVTTYQGIATEWLAHQDVDRSKLGLGSNGLPDSQSGLYKRDSNIQQLTVGDVALLKGELWKGNEHAGLVHRSPALLANESRLLLTLDFSD